MDIRVEIEWDDGDPSVGVRAGWHGWCRAGDIEIQFGPYEDVAVHNWPVFSVDLAADAKTNAYPIHDKLAGYGPAAVAAVAAEWAPKLRRVNEMAQQEARWLSEEEAANLEGGA